MRPIFASLTTLECESLPEVSERIFQAGCDPFPELKTKAACLSERNSMTTPPPDPNTAVFPGFSSFTFNSPWVKKGGLHSPAALPTVSGLPLCPLPTSPLVNNAVNAQLIHSWGGERPIQFILHIKGLKRHLPHIGDTRETAISTLNLSGGSRSMLPNQWQPYGRQKVRHRKQTNKEVRTNIMINWWLCPSQQPAGLNYWRAV